MNNRSPLSRWLAVILWAAVIFALSSIEQIKVSEFFLWDFIVKKTAHVGEYAILFALIFRATRKNWVLTFLLTMGYAVTDEYHQSFVPGRSATFLDLGFDASGVNIASYIIWKLKPRLTWSRQIHRKKPRK
ncbi:VanZ family protein [Candidatus Curtissbacteria bacterium]|nr:VanZ family protein [Candidatus Curtissbacteria bacterium]MBI2594402.1 VanZ family protein [Candidatus Curtissbacteria bacterium]